MMPLHSAPQWSARPSHSFAPVPILLSLYLQLALTSPCCVLDSAPIVSPAASLPPSRCLTREGGEAVGALQHVPLGIHLQQVSVERVEYQLPG